MKHTYKELQYRKKLDFRLQILNVLFVPAALISALYLCGNILDPSFNPARPALISVSGISLGISVGVLWTVKMYPRLSTRYKLSRRLSKERFQLNFEMSQFNDLWAEHCTKLDFLERSWKGCELGYGPIEWDGPDFTLHKLAIISVSGPSGFISEAKAKLDDRTRMHKTLEVTSFNTSYQLGVSRGAENLLSSDSRFNTYEDYETTGYAYVHVKGTSGNKGTIPFKSAETALEFVNHFAQLVHNYTDNLSQLDADIQDMRGLLWECRNLTPEDFGHSEILARLASFEEREWRVIFPQNLEDFLSFAHGNISLNRAR